MKYASPMMAILDIFMLLVLALIAESSPKIKIVLDKPTKSMIIVQKNQTGNIKKYYDTSVKIWRPFSDLNSNSYNYIIGNIPCSRALCKDVRYSNKNYIYLRDDLAKEISSLVTDSCLGYPQQCVNVRYHIVNDQVDKKRLCKEYPLFKNLLLECKKGVKNE